MLWRSFNNIIKQNIDNNLMSMDVKLHKYFNIKRFKMTDILISHDCVNGT